MERRDFCKRIGVVTATLGLTQEAKAGEPAQPEPQPQRFELGPAGVIVLKSPVRLTKTNVEYLSQCMAKTFPGHKVVVLEDGMELQTVSVKDKGVPCV